MGQLFLHRIFGYRGVIVYPWMAIVNDNDLKRKHLPNEPTTSGSQAKQHDADTPKPPRQQSSIQSKRAKLEAMDTKPLVHPYYLCLIDSRDCPHVSRILQTAAVTFLGQYQGSSRQVYSIKALDYVAHEDIIPYVSREERPIHHELFDKFFRYDPHTPHHVARESLETWKNGNPWLELSQVYRETTENVRVTVIPFFLGSTDIHKTVFYWWRYCVRLENMSDNSVKLVERDWKIFSMSGTLETIKARGVVGIEPLLTKTEPAFQYSSHINLVAQSGHMWYVSQH
ncbi:polymerase delta-interacting protein 2, partial [Fragariocoptes setiger]